MMNKIKWLWLLLMLAGCRPSADWRFETLLPVEGASPVGIALLDGDLMVSDVENNRVLRIDSSGQVLERFDGFQRPMHLFAEGGKLFVPEYLTDTIKILQNGRQEILPLRDTVNAPAAVAVEGEWVAVADFYNHRILLQNRTETLSLGKEGHGKGELYYPTDVAIYGDKIFVADAYNNRVQVFDLKGNSLQIIGDRDNIQTATGIVVKDNRLFVTDFEGNRVLVYNLQGALQQQLTDQLQNPSDVDISGDKLYVVNYGSESIAVFQNK